MTSEIFSSKALILLASRPETVEIAVRRIRPEVLGVIVSQEILEAVTLKCSELRAQGVEFRYRMVDSPMEIGDSFSRFEHLLLELEGMGYGRDEVLLDATGGTTPMRLGAALAAMTRGVGMVHQRVPQVYVGGRWERDGSREVEVAPMGNPLVATGLLREGQGVELFNRRDYGAAALVFGDIVGKVSGAERGHYYRGLLLLAEGYAAWDVADYGVALEKLREARGEMGVELSETALAERAGALSDRISVHLPFLGKVRGRLSAENVVDMLENARRRIVDQRRYDDGVARLYRCVEMWHQWRLGERSISTEKVDWGKVDGDVRERFLEEAGLVEPPEVLALRHARLLDRILGGEEAEDEAVLRDLLQKRNRSILAHGLEPIDRKSALRFLEYVDALVEAPEARVGVEHATLRGL
ncbi:MAG: TIGR02710 family CRISPR-associated CARF protein [Actinomycetota bacterium]|nr:TIGR02710 family CRISPR-associated CARF protein [Actinomycetota bacterium]